MAHGVDATSLDDEATIRAPSPDALAAEPSGQQLPPSDNPMLLLGERSQEINGIPGSHTDP